MYSTTFSIPFHPTFVLKRLTPSRPLVPLSSLSILSTTPPPMFRRKKQPPLDQNNDQNGEPNPPTTTTTTTIDEKSASDNPPPVSFFRLFRFATKWEIFFNWIGVVCAMAAGAAQVRLCSSLRSSSTPPPSYSPSMLSSLS